MISDQHNQRGFRGFGGRPASCPRGPLLIVNGRELAMADPAGFGYHGAYKIPLVLALGSTATVTIAPAARGHVVIDNPYARLRGIRDLVAATYRACSRKPGFFAQGFAFTDGRTRGCLPLDVSIDHQPRIRQVTLSLLAGSCAR